MEPNEKKLFESLSENSRMNYRLHSDEDLSTLNAAKRRRNNDEDDDFDEEEDENYYEEDEEEENPFDIEPSEEDIIEDEFPDEDDLFDEDEDEDTFR